MSRDREMDAGPRHWPFLSFAVMGALAGACTQSSEARPQIHPPSAVDRSGPPAAPAEVATRASKPPMTRVRVGNDDPRGAAHQPDYDGEATLLKRSMDRRLPSNLPAIEAACRDMLDAAERLYRTDEPDPARRGSLSKRFRATRAHDFEGCVRQTSVAAAVCTTILLRRQQAEFPWLLDQCTRAYPRTATNDPASRHAVPHAP